MKKLMLVVALVGCKSHEGREAERAAETVRAKVIDQEQRELPIAEQTFEQRKARRLAELERELDALAASPAELERRAAAAKLSDKERTKLDESIAQLKSRLETARTALAQLRATGANEWNGRDDIAMTAVDRADDAREDAVEVLDDHDGS